MTTTTTFESDLTSAREALDDARAELGALVTSLTDADLAAARRGGWTIARVLHHVIQGETYYTGTIGYLNSNPTSTQMPASAPASIADALAGLQTSGDGFRAALHDISEDAFYTVKPVAHEEFSILSLLENVAHHDAEHTAQIRSILGALAS